jgi:acyl-CoA reductase-like NAD-dependent aldehyde dehydrogenase
MDIGSLVNASGLNKIDSQVKDSIKEGAEVLTVGEQTRSKGYLYKPTIMKDAGSWRDPQSAKTQVPDEDASTG